ADLETLGDGGLVLSVEGRRFTREARGESLRRFSGQMVALLEARGRADVPLRLGFTDARLHAHRLCPLPHAVAGSWQGRGQAGAVPASGRTPTDPCFAHDRARRRRAISDRVRWAEALVWPDGHVVRDRRQG